MNFKKISALACTMTILGGMATATPVFAADNKTSTVPVVGKVGLWQDGTTDPTNPDNGGSGGNGENNEVNKPDNVTDINVTVPTSMTFNVATNTKDGEPTFASAEYQVTNNGISNVNMTGQYNVTSNGGITLVEESAVEAKKDGNINLALSLKYGDSKGSVNTAMIENVTNTASSSPIEVAASGSKFLKFDSTKAGMEDVKKEASNGGALDNATKTTQGNLVLTFQAVGE